MPDNKMPLIGVCDFAQRQTPESHHNHFNGNWDELTELVTAAWDQRRISPHNPEVVLVPMPEALLHRFFTSTVAITPNTPLQATFAPRVEGEAPFVQISVQAPENHAMPASGKTPAQRVDIIVYSHATLAQDGDAPIPQLAQYYIVSINAYASPQEEPMHPMTMARNLLGLKGGTQPKIPYTPEEFAEAIVYWSQHARVTH